MGWNHHYDRNDYDYDFDKDINVDIDTNLSWNTDIDFDKDVDVDIDINAYANVVGNIAQLTLDAEAIGYDSLVEVDASVLTVEYELSSIALSVISVAA